MRDWLRTIRKMKKMTEAQVAQAAEIAQPYYHNIEHGKKTPSPNVAKKIAAVLKFDWTLFFETEKTA